MLYELAYPALVIASRGRLMRARLKAVWSKQPLPQLVGDLQLRALKSRCRRMDIQWLARISPKAGALLALRRFETSEKNGIENSSTLKVDDVVFTKEGTIAVRTLGAPGKRKILVLHGWNADGVMMLPLVAALANAGFHVIFPDLPGEGASAPYPVPFYERGRLVAEACNRFGPFEAVIGHSAGGLIAGIALQEGLKAARLITICSPTSLQSLLNAYLVRIQAPESVKAVVVGVYRSLYGHDPAVVGPEIFTRMNARLLIAHAKPDWQVRVAEALEISRMAPQAATYFSDRSNHRSILRDLHLHRVICDFVEADTRSIEGIRC